LSILFATFFNCFFIFTKKGLLMRFFGGFQPFFSSRFPTIYSFFVGFWGCLGRKLLQKRGLSPALARKKGGTGFRLCRK